MKEIWKDVPGYEGIYQVSNQGRIKSLDRSTCIFRKGTDHERILHGQILVQMLDKSGYCRVWLYKNKKRKYVLVSRIVAKAFLPNPDNLPQVNHKSEVKTDNSVENLEWCDEKYNSNYGTAIKRRSEKNKKRIIQLSKDGTELCYWYSITDAANETGLSISAISHCLTGRRKTTGGFAWKFAS
jgi:hypothetical protein